MRFSIITINYNNREGLRKTIESVISQTITDYEYIVIDGGSTDGSRELIEQHQDHFAYWCSEPDKGIYNAMNKGIDHSKGDYILFLNSGDLFYDRFVLQNVASLNCNCDIITGQVVRMDNDILIRRYDDDLLLQLLNNTLNHQGSFINKSLFEKQKYDESLKIVSDWKFWIETIVYGNAKVLVIDKIIAKQDMSGISYDSKYKDLRQEERESVLKSYFPPLIRKDLLYYSSIRQNSIYNNLNYLKNNHYFAYRILVKVTNTFVTICRKLMG